MATRALLWRQRLAVLQWEENLRLKLANRLNRCSPRWQFCVCVSACGICVCVDLKLYCLPNLLSSFYLALSIRRWFRPANLAPTVRSVHDVTREGEISARRGLCVVSRFVVLARNGRHIAVFIDSGHLFRDRNVAVRIGGFDTGVDAITRRIRVFRR